MIRKFNVLHAIFVFFLFVNSVYAATYFVDVNGSDLGGNGTKAKPWKSIAYGVKYGKAGDLISVNDGVYNESRIIIPAGVSLTSTVQDKTKVTIQPNTSFGTDDPFVDLKSSSVGSSGNQSISHLTFNGVNGSIKARIGIRVQNRSDVRIHHCNIINFNGKIRSHGIRLESTEVVEPCWNWWNYWPADPQSPGTDTNIDALWPDNPIEDIEVDNNTIINCGYRAGLKIPETDAVHPAIYTRHLKDSTIHHNTINTVNSLGPAIHATSAFLWNVDIYNNDMTMAHYLDRGSYIIEVWLLRNGCEIYNNTANAFFSIAYGKETKIHNNHLAMIPHGTSSYPQGAGIEFHGQNEGEVYANYIEGAANAIIFGVTQHTFNDSRTIRNLLIRNNVIYSPHRNGITLIARGGEKASQHSYTVTIDGVNIYNNTIHKIRHQYYQGIRVEEEQGTYGTLIVKNINIKNNIITAALGYAGLARSSIENLNIANNLYYDNGTYYGGGAEYNNFTGVSETNKVLANPDFLGQEVNYSGYKLAEGSPAIDSGIKVGLPFFGSTMDIGAIEFGLGPRENDPLIPPSNLKIGFN